MNQSVLPGFEFLLMGTKEIIQEYLYFERSSNPTDTKIGRWFVERKVPLKEFL